MVWPLSSLGSRKSRCGPTCEAVAAYLTSDGEQRADLHTDEVARETGDIEYADYAAHAAVHNSIYAGAPRATPTRRGGLPRNLTRSRESAESRARQSVARKSLATPRIRTILDPCGLVREWHGRLGRRLLRTRVENVELQQRKLTRATLQRL